MNALQVRGLTKHYPAFTLKDVSFDVPYDGNSYLHRADIRHQKRHPVEGVFF